MAALVVLFNLKNNASQEAYEKWAITTDVPTASNMSSVDSFKVFKLGTIMGTNNTSPFQYCEVLEINDMTKLGEEVTSETMQKVAAEFQEFADNPTFIISEQIA
ncbi:REDY-like protein HapK [Maribacter vaceletii]|uniref:REDY-like protein HapK n=1 Tax=Maribacter vaceletii TaxID=1206816 RepID=A0A495EGY6_9FLAO|nr:REDY-like protein HapK [Maribacter vaceletii]RKR15227.1 REDY-like protein HapK [Maribacter vaceletii]